MSWAEDIKESGSEHSNAEDLFDSRGGNTEMVSPSTSHRSGLPSGPPDPITPTPKRSKGKKKRTSTAAKLVSPLSCVAPSVSCPGSSLSASADPFRLAPLPSSTPSSAESSVAMQFAAPTFRSTYGVLDMVASLNDILSSWAGKSWEVERDMMHMVQAVSITVRHVVNAGWHTLPFEDSPNSPMLALVLHDMLPQAPPTLVPTCGSAESAAPGPSSKPHGPPSEATACPPPASKPAPSPRPMQSTKHPLPPSTSVKCSYADMVRDVTSLVNLAKMVPDLPSDCIIVMHQASVPLALPKRKINTLWAEDVEESRSEHSDTEDLSDSRGGDAEMASPSTSHRSGLPSGPPDPIMPTPKRSKDKKKRMSAVAELTSPPLCVAPPVSCPGSFLSTSTDPFWLAPLPSSTPSPAGSSVAMRFAASTSRSTYGVLDMVASLNDILSSWAGQSWEVECDTMRMAWAVSITVCHVVNAGWHTLPFKDSPNSPTLASVMRDVLPQAPPTLVPTRGSTESAAPDSSSKPCGPPSEATAHPPLASKPAPPPRPTWSAKHPLPPSTSVKRSYVDMVCDVTSLVNLAKMVPDLPSDCIIMMHQASVPLVLPKRKIKSTIPGPSWAANHSLSKGNLWVDFCHFAYGGISLLTSHVASQAEIDLASLPKSQSYLKIMDIPFFKVDGDQITSADVRVVMEKSHLVPSFTLANSPWVMHNSRHANTATVWFNVLDLQLGATAKHLINTSFQFSPSSLLIMELNEKYQRMKHSVEDKLSFDKDSTFSTFETTIRILGGLLGAFHQTDYDPMQLP
ncbi:Endoplasmic reticulum mannosyl-oligosaccharide 1,2-alpha-mannosidase [Leucoagaricus sp. SymC.cos]|nr:Endoplasmic reticulum mannosyl-oligosaccharide 1,2-alpha-mannosidase [Leucoagaricus sp. SymC.cos]